MYKCQVAIEDNMDCQKCCFYCEKKNTCDDVCPDVLNNTEMKCNDLIGEETELDVIASAVPDVLKAITDITVEKKRLDDQEKIMKKKLLEAMEEHGIKSFENAQVKFMYVAPTTRTSIDSARLKKELPEVAEQYSKTSNVSASVRITVK